MNIIDIINKKRLKQSLTDEELKYVIDGYLSGEIKDYQMSSLLMAIVLNGMEKEEIFSLTKYMANSGDILNLSHLGTTAPFRQAQLRAVQKTRLSPPACSRRQLFQIFYFLRPLK